MDKKLETIEQKISCSFLSNMHQIDRSQYLNYCLLAINLELFYKKRFEDNHIVYQTGGLYF